MSEPTVVYPPVAGESRRRRSLHVAAAAAAGLYAFAGWSAWTIVDGARAGQDTAGLAVPTVGAVAGVQAMETRDTLATRVLAARAQQSVFRLEAAGGGTGTAFVAWTARGASFVVAAHRSVEGLLADGGRSVFLQRAGRVWTGRVLRVDRANGLVLVRVPGRLADPLWQSRRDASLREADGAVVVGAGGATGFGEGVVTAAGPRRLTVSASVGDAGVGAPVLDAGGRVVGVVTGVRGAASTVVPIERACAVVRRCA